MDKLQVELEQAKEAIVRVGELFSVLEGRNLTLDVVFSPQMNPDVPPALPAQAFDTILTCLVQCRRLLKTLDDRLSLEPDEETLFTYRVVVLTYEGILLRLLELSNRMLGGIVNAARASTEHSVEETKEVRDIEKKIVETPIKGRAKRKKPKLPY